MKNIDRIVSKILTETLEVKAEIITRKIFAKEEEGFKDGRKKIDVAEPKGKITSADFKELRKGKKTETKEDWKKVAKESASMANKYIKEMSKETKEGNEFSDSRCKAICSGKNSFKVGSKSYPLKGVDMEDKKSCGCKSVKESKIRFTETELIDLIERLVIEEKEAPGIAITKKNLNSSKKVNDESLKDTSKKMKEYLKDGSKEEYNPNPQHFPMGNGELAKMDKMAYVPSEAVDEYQDAFSYPGMTNLVFDEIKPDDEKIEMYLKGDSKTGNAQKGKDGKDLGNVVSSKVGDKFKKNYDENLYGAEQMNASYKRQPQPVDIAGNVKQSGSLKKLRGGKNSTEKANKIMSQLESLEDKKKKLVSEEFDKMKHLINYDKKTQ